MNICLLDTILAHQHIESYDFIGLPQGSLTYNCTVFTIQLLQATPRRDFQKFPLPQYLKNGMKWFLFNIINKTGQRILKLSSLIH